MVCAQCGRQVHSGDAFCMNCGKALPASAAPQKKKTSMVDRLEGALFLVMGALLLVMFVILLLGTVGPAIQTISGLPAVSTPREALWETEAYIAHILLPAVLAAFSALMWSLGGLFLVLAGCFSLLAGKGLGQARAAVVLALFGFFSHLFSQFFLYRYAASIAQGVWQDLWLTVHTDWLNLLMQAAVIVITLVLCQLKARAQRYTKRKKLEQQAEAIKAMRAGEQAASVPQPAAPRPSVQMTPNYPPLYPQRPVPSAVPESKVKF